METYIVPCPTGDSWTPVDQVPIALARQRTVQGRLFRKHILNMGTLIHPVTGRHIPIDQAFVENVQRNFRNGVCDIVQVPVADERNKHTETPLANIGEVVGVEREGNKVYALIDARKHAEDLGKTILGASAFLSTDYVDTTSGQRSGPTLLHVAATNRPYVTGLDDYEEIVAATADGISDTVVLTPEEETMGKEEMLAALKAEHGIDVEALQEAATHRTDLSGLAAQLSQVLEQSGQGGSLQLSADSGVTADDLVGAVAELAQLSNAQGDQISQLHRERAEREVDGYVSQGRVLPKQRDVFIALAMSDRDQMEVLLPDQPVVPIEQRVGLAAPRGERARETDIESEMERLAKQPGTARFFSANGSKH